MKTNSTHFLGIPLCLPEKKFFQFVTFSGSVAHSRQCTKKVQNILEKLPKSVFLRLSWPKKMGDISHMQW